VGLRLRRALLGLLLVFGASSGAQAYEADPAIEQAKADLAGAYRLVDGGTKKVEVRQAVDRGTEGMRLFRGMARDDLYRTTTPLPLVALKFPSDDVSVIYLGERAMKSRADGTPAKWVGRFGDKTTMRQNFERGRLVQRFKARMGGRRTNVYHLSADGKRLTIHSTITADPVPDPIKFTLTYVRK
jgi:hypothetical protein